MRGLDLSLFRLGVLIPIAQVWCLRTECVTLCGGLSGACLRVDTTVCVCVCVCARVRVRACVRASMRVRVWTPVRACAGTDTSLVDVESNGDGRAARVAGSAIEAD